MFFAQIFAQKPLLSGKAYEISPFGRNDGAYIGFDIGGGWLWLRCNQPPYDQCNSLSSRTQQSGVRDLISQMICYF